LDLFDSPLFLVPAFASAPRSCALIETAFWAKIVFLSIHTKASFTREKSAASRLKTKLLADTVTFLD